MTLRSPIIWFGGKGQIKSKILPQLPDHHLYVEGFGGGASLLFAKVPSPVEVYNDLNSGLVNFFRVLRDAERCTRLHYPVSTTPFSREEFTFCRDTWMDCSDVVERAYRWFVVNRMSYGGIFGGSWARGIDSSKRGMAEKPSTWLSTHERLGAAHARLMRVQIEQQDFRKLLPAYDTPETLFYLDPPYVPETRRSGGYQHELSVDDHKELVELILAVQGKVILSGYRTDVYGPLEKSGWVRGDFSVPCTTGSNTSVSGRKGAGGLREQRRTESLWISPRAQNGRRKAKLAMPSIHYRLAPKRAAA